MWIAFVVIGVFTLVLCYVTAKAYRSYDEEISNLIKRMKDD
jgi:hypothetical protein